MPLVEPFLQFVERQRKRKQRLAAAHRLGRDEAAWSELFRREEWAPIPAGHPGHCGRCGAAIELERHLCPNCGAEWGANARRGDLFRQIMVIGGAMFLSAAIGYASAIWVRGLFRGKNANPEMVDTLSSFSWLLFGVLAMIGFTYLIEHFNLAPIGHWRMQGERARRKTDS